MKLVPINERLASKLISEHPSLTGEIVEIRTIFSENGVPVFQMKKEVKNDQEWVSYSMYMPEYKQGE